jgi:hypothetical protein
VTRCTGDGIPAVTGVTKVIGDGLIPIVEGVPVPVRVNDGWGPGAFVFTVNVAEAGPFVVGTNWAVMLQLNVGEIVAFVLQSASPTENCPAAASLDARPV